MAMKLKRRKNWDQCSVLDVVRKPRSYMIRFELAKLKKKFPPKICDTLNAILYRKIRFLFRKNGKLTQSIQNYIYCTVSYNSLEINANLLFSILLFVFGFVSFCMISIVINCVKKSLKKNLKWLRKFVKRNGFVLSISEHVQFEPIYSDPKAILNDSNRWKSIRSRLIQLDQSSFL